MEFKKNIYESLNIVDFKNEDELISYFFSALEYMNVENDYSCVAIYGKSEFIWSIFKKIEKTEKFEVGSLDFRRGYFDDAEDVFCLRVYDDDMLTLENAYNHDYKPYCVDGIVLINENDCEQDLIDRALKDEADVTLFGFKEEKPIKDCEEKHCPHVKKTDDKIKVYADNGVAHGIYAEKNGDGYTRSLDYYSSEALTPDDIKKILEQWNFRKARDISTRSW